MTPQEKAESLGVKFTKQEPGYLAMVVRTGNLLITSGHVSDIKGKLGAALWAFGEMGFDLAAIARAKTAVQVPGQ